VQLLQGVAPGIQDTCRVYVAECRPKSPEPFRDACDYCEALRSTGYSITLIPDAAAGNLVQRGEIGKVFLGAHGVFLDARRHPRYVVNTCGSWGIIVAAEKAGIPVYVVTEADKLETMPKKGVDGVTSYEEVGDVTSYEQEENIFPNVDLRSSFAASGRSVGTLNVGYDICEVLGNVTIVTEKN